MLPDWPDAEFIVGNPPFIGGKDLRAKLGGDYAEALWMANPRVPKSADFVMHWWDRAAHTLVAQGSPLRRFGFVTTNSITQEFSRRVMASYLEGGQVSLVMAIPDHPWTKATRQAAAVRIAMTVAAPGTHDGRLVEVVKEAGLDSDEPQLVTLESWATIHADLSTGTNLGSSVPLLANKGVGSRGVQLMGAGFIVSPKEAAHLGLGTRPGLDAHIRPYLNGRDMLQRTRGAMVIDLFGLDESEVRHETRTVERPIAVPGGYMVNPAVNYAKHWWACPATSRQSKLLSTGFSSSSMPRSYPITCSLPSPAMMPSTLACSSPASMWNGL
jgi:hypothetical protein